MNLSIRYIALAMLIAFSGAQVGAMETNDHILNQNNVASQSLINAMETEKGQGYIDQAMEKIGSVVEFTQEFITEHPAISGTVGVVALSTGVYLVYRNDVHVKIYNIVHSGIVKAKQHPWISAATAATIIGLGLAQYKYGIAGTTATKLVEGYEKVKSWIPDPVKNVFAKFSFGKTAAGISAASTAYSIVKNFSLAGNDVQLIPVTAANNNNNNNNQPAVKTSSTPAAKKAAPAVKNTQPAQTAAQKQSAPAAQTSAPKASAQSQQSAAVNNNNNNNNNASWFSRGNNAQQQKAQLIETLQGELEGKVQIGSASTLIDSKNTELVNSVKQFEETLGYYKTYNAPRAKQDYFNKAQKQLNNIKNILK